MSNIKLIQSKAFFIALLSPIALSLLVILLQTSCGVENATSTVKLLNEDIDILRRFAESNLAEFSRIDPNRTSSEYNNSIEMRALADYIISSDEINAEVKDSIIEFFNCAENSGIEIDQNYIDALWGVDKMQVDSKIAMFQYLASERLLNRYKNTFFVFKYGKPLAIPRTKEIKLGNDLIVDFYFACMDKNNKFKIVIDNDTLINYSDAVPQYIFSPQKIGKHLVNGDFILNQPLKGIKSYPFEFEYSVK